MGWAVGYDDILRRDIGYGVPAVCEHPHCLKNIHRGLAYRCGGAHGDGCHLYFCSDHLYLDEANEQVCERCKQNKHPFDPKPDVRA